MNAAEQGAIARALEAAGIRFVKPQRAGAKIIGWETVPTTAAIGRILAAFGWRVELQSDPTPGTDATLEQSGQATLRLLP